MLTLIPAGAEPRVETLTPESLDQLWHEATQLGCLRVYQSEYNRAYEVTISFSRPTGTKIEARGKDSEIGAAVAKAINEAREMGAGAHG
jgi:fructose-bisphosphate aldolase class 1